MLQSTENCTARPRLVFKEGFTKLRVGGAEKEFQNYTGIFIFFPQVYFLSNSNFQA